MALDPRISLSVQPAGILEAAQQGLQFGQQYAQQKAMNPLQQEALKAQTAQTQAQAGYQNAETGKLDMAKQIAGAGYMAGAIQQLQQLPQEQRWPTAQLHLAKMQAMGLDTTGIDESHMTDDALKQAYSVVAPIAQMAQQGQRHGPQTVGGTSIINTPNGPALAVGVFNNGQFSTQTAPLGGAPMVGGETPLEKRLAELKFKQQQLELERLSALQGAQEQAPVKVQTAGNVATSEATAKAVENKKIEVLDGATAAADVMPTLKQTLSLLKSGAAETGGANVFYKKVANVLNLDTSDAETVEREFKGRLLIAGQKMKGTLSDADMKILGGTGPEFSISTKANIKILSNLMNRMDAEIERGKKIIQKNPAYGSAYIQLDEYGRGNPQDITDGKKAAPLQNSPQGDQNATNDDKKRLNEIRASKGLPPI